MSETYPKGLKIRKGQTVRWHFSLIYETHSATFPLVEELWFGQIETFNLVCDPDGDSGPGPDVTFRKASGDNPYTFFCFFHGPQMFTRINVR